jgi:hypothetical protein
MESKKRKKRGEEENFDYSKQANSRKERKALLL